MKISLKHENSSHKIRIIITPEEAKELGLAIGDRVTLAKAYVDGGSARFVFAIGSGGRLSYSTAKVPDLVTAISIKEIPAEIPEFGATTIVRRQDQGNAFMVEMPSILKKFTARIRKTTALQQVAELGGTEPDLVAPPRRRPEPVVPGSHEHIREAVSLVNSVIRTQGAIASLANDGTLMLRRTVDY